MTTAAKLVGISTIGRKIHICPSGGESGRCSDSGELKSWRKFVSVHASLHNHFNQECHLVDRQTYKERRSAALAKWKSLAS